MSAIVPYSKGGACSICLSEFEAKDLPITHKGAELHHGFHKECLAGWVVRNATCPLDRQPINLHSLISRTDRIWLNFTSSLTAMNVLFMGGAIAGVGCIITLCGVIKTIIEAKAVCKDQAAVDRGIYTTGSGVAMIALGALNIAAACVRMERNLTHRTE